MHENSHQKLLVTSSLLTVMLVILVRNAWVTEDAYITLRVVENFLAGHGLRWNIHERVQVFTSPLWTLLLCLSSALTGEVYFSTIALSIATATITGWALLTLLCGNSAISLSAFVLLIVCKSWVDFAVSGLENPLSALLLVLFFAEYLQPEPRLRRFFCFAALLLCTRFDNLFLILLPCLHVAHTFRSKQVLSAALIGFAPFILWCAFSLLYYGFVFPNTAYSKLGHGIPIETILFQGLLYFVKTTQTDPILFPLLVSGCVLAFLQGGSKGKILAASLLFSMFYVLWVGGDFMAGRFFGGAALIACCAVAHFARRESTTFSLVILALILLGATHSRSPISSSTDGVMSQPVAAALDHSGVADERGVFYRHSGLLHASRAKHPPFHVNRNIGEELRSKSLTQERLVQVTYNVGYMGYFAGPNVIIVDPNGLTDPLLSRLPTVSKDDWRIGHFARNIPKGFLDTIGTSGNVIADPFLREYYSNMRILTEAPLFSFERLSTIFLFQVGHFEYLLSSPVKS